MTNPDVFYLSADDYRAQTLVPALVTPLSDDAVTSLLLEVMVDIDAYIGVGWTPLKDGQEFIFPRYQDTDPGMPRSIAIATRLIADAILTKRSKGVLPHEVVSEGNLGHNYQKKATPQARAGFEYFPPEACAKLEPFIRSGGQLAVPDPWLGWDASTW